MYKQAFKSHPYRWPVIGWMKDIKAVTHEKAVAFYKRFYAPNNAVLVIAGNIDPAATLDLIARHYGGIPAAEPPPPDRAQPERAPAARGARGADPPGARRSAGDRIPGARARAIAIAPPTRSLARSSRAGRRRVCTGCWSWTSSGRRRCAPTSRRRAIPACTRIWVQMTKGHAAEQAETRDRGRDHRAGGAAGAGRRAGQGDRAPGDGVLGAARRPATAAPRRWANSRPRAATSRICSRARRPTQAVTADDVRARRRDLPGDRRALGRRRRASAERARVGR